MVRYRRNFIKGVTYFFTANLHNRNLNLLTDHIDLLRDSIKKVKTENPFSIKAIVILPDHIHAIWELPKNDDDYSLRWRRIKRNFTHELVKRGETFSKNKHGEYDLWQRRFWEHTILDERDMENHVNYIHYNPVKHGYVNKVVDWEYSSFHHYVREGLLSEDLAGGDGGMDGGDVGE